MVVSLSQRDNHYGDGCVFIQSVGASLALKQWEDWTVAVWVSESCLCVATLYVNGLYI